METINSIELSSTTAGYAQLFAWYLEDRCPDQDCSAVYDRANKGCEERLYDKVECANGLKESIDIYCTIGNNSNICNPLLSTWALVGLAIGVILIVLFVGVAIYCIKKRKKAKNQQKNSGTTTTGTTNGSTATGGNNDGGTLEQGRGTGTTTNNNANTGVTGRY
ncbi:unnamed protein product [Caenorhabditis nigoni]